MGNFASQRYSPIPINWDPARAMLWLELVVQPIDVPCRYCKAAAGSPCMKWRRSRKGKVIRGRGPHRDRKYDAKLATEAVRALDPR